MFSPPATTNGGVAVTDPITAAVVPLLVSVTFSGLLVPVASTLPNLIAAGAAASVVVAPATGWMAMNRGEPSSVCGPLMVAVGVSLPLLPGG